NAPGGWPAAPAPLDVAPVPPDVAPVPPDVVPVPPDAAPGPCRGGEIATVCCREVAGPGRDAGRAAVQASLSTRSARQSSQVLWPTARSGARVAPARTAP